MAKFDSEQPAGLEAVANSHAIGNDEKQRYVPPPNVNIQPSNGLTSGHLYYPPETPDQGICGLRKRTFWLLIALVAVIVAAAVGGGVGGALANRRNNTQVQSPPEEASSGQATQTDQQATSTVTASATARQSDRESVSASATSAGSASKSSSTPGSPVVMAQSPQQPQPYTGCDEVNGTLYEASYGGSYLKVCGLDWGTDDILGVMVNTFDYCIEACASWNYQSKSSRECASIAFIPSWSNRDGVEGFISNCVLKGPSTGYAIRRPGLDVHYAKLQ
ncbi:MAG: hypothetical protein M1837_005555 [Sclerophora amabilis]|nr:MAG: hypothetical protein M1837_005555 [Sclerophora amabilis]